MNGRRLGLAVCAVLAPFPAMAAGDVPAGPSPWMITPFVLLLLGIAVMPFINKHWWERWYPAVAGVLGLMTVLYYVIVLENPGRMLGSGHEYVSFIILIGALFVVAGGIHIRIKGRSTPLRNVALLALGAVISNVLGTTGASMIMIRPFIRVNRYRIRPYHVVFFIFLVSNIGGALTPIGDPPLFLGYLKGVPFFWVAEYLWGKWLVAVALVLGVFFVVDWNNFRKLPASIRHGAEGQEEEGEASGVHNVLFLGVIVGAAFINDPPFLREALMLAAAAGSYLSTKAAIHKKNAFTFGPVKEVAILFAGIFATMVPALDWLEHNAANIGLHSPGHFYWATGSLSAFLDNAPTYLNFLSASIGLFVNDALITQVQAAVAQHGGGVVTVLGTFAEEIRNTLVVLLRYHGDAVAAGAVPSDAVSTAFIMGNHAIYLQAISLAAVFFGACSYIGNGPNFMVKSIAEESGIRTPSFFGYIVRYTVPVLIPIFVIEWLVYFR